MLRGSVIRPRSGSLRQAAVGLCLISGLAAITAPLAATADEAPIPPIRMVASIFPLGDIARELGGDAVAVDVLLPPGLTPHDFEAKPPDVERLANGEVLLLVGLGADLWARSAANAAGNDRLRIFTMAGMVPADSLRRGDPHIWLDPLLMERFVAALADSLCALRPQLAPRLRQRESGLRDRLLELHQDHRRRLAAVSGEAVVCLHAAYGYLTARYGLRQVSVFREHMEEPGPAAMEEVVTFIREHDVTVLFVQPQMPPGSTRWLQEQTGVDIEVLDPLGGSQQTGYGSYLTMMRSNLERLASALAP